MRRRFRKIMILAMAIILVICLVGFVAFAHSNEVQADKLSIGWKDLNYIRGNNIYKFSVIDIKDLVKDKPLKYNRPIIIYLAKCKNKAEYWVRGPDNECRFRI